MRYRRLGTASGLKVSEIAYGAWVTFGNQVDEKGARELIHRAYDLGVNFFDNADVYANGQAEILMGKAIKGLPREALVISTKVFWPTMPGPNGRGLSRKHIMESIHASLKRLDLDYVDIYYCHRFDPEVPLEEVVYTMDTLIRQGKILYWGTSEWTPAQIVRAWAIAKENHWAPPVVEQPQYNMFHRRRVEVDLVPVARDLGIGLTTWSPLYYGILTGKYNDGIPEGSRASLERMAWMRDYITPERIAKVRELGKLAQELGVTTAQLAIAWLLRVPEVSAVITGATKVHQLEENVAAVEVVDKLDNEVLERIERILQNAPEG
ncbi:MAG: aldo/keto reductase [Chloroflexi bacterium]|nr:aldo/keto reductase [Chloroflexota bacterium]